MTEPPCVKGGTSDLADFIAELQRPQPLHRRIRYAFKRRLNWLRHLRHEPVYAWQRATRGYSERDTWGFDFYLSQVIAGGCRRLRERSIGYPNGLTADEWDATLDKIIEGFECAASDHLEAREDERVKEAFALFSKHYFSLWD